MEMFQPAFWVRGKGMGEVAVFAELVFGLEEVLP